MAGGSVVLCGLNPNVREAFDMSGSLSIFTVHDDSAKAIPALNRDA